MKSFKMKKLAASTIAATVLFTAATSAQAATLSQTFTVNVNLSGACRITTAAPVLNFGTYTAFGAATTPAPTASITMECTRNIAAPVYSFENATGEGVLAGLNYTVTASAPIAAPGTPAAVGTAGTPDIYTVSLLGDMIAGQAGQCGTAGSTQLNCDGATVQTDATRLLTVTY